MSKSLASIAMNPGECVTFAGVVGLAELAEVGAGLFELAALAGMAAVLLVETIFFNVVFSSWVFTESGPCA